MAHLVAPQAKADLDEIWLYGAKSCGSMEVANRLIDSLTDRFCFLAGFPHAGRARDLEIGRGCRSFPVGEYLIIDCVEGSEVSILRVVQGWRELEKLFEL
jgi:toxin ParE1/3/4